MFSNRQENSSNLLHLMISTSSQGILPSPPPISIDSVATNSNYNSTVTSAVNLTLDGFNCGGIPTRTTPTLTPTPLRHISADIAILSSGPSKDSVAAAASYFHNLVCASCTTLNVSSSGVFDHLRFDLQDRHTLQNLVIQHLNLQNVNNQLINLDDLQNQQCLNQNSLNQQQRNGYNNNFSSATSRQAGFVPPLVLQISSSNTPQLTGVSNNSSGSNSIFNAKGISTTASSSHWQGAVVTQRPQSQTQSATKRQFTDDEDFDKDNVSTADYGTDSSNATSVKITQKQNSKNNSKSRVKSESKSTANIGRQTNYKDNKIMLAKEEQRQQMRRERNKLAAARCRKRRKDRANKILVEREQLEEKRLRLQAEIQSIHQQITDLLKMLDQQKCNMNNGSVSNLVSTVNHTNTVLDSNAISESGTTVLSNNMPTTKINSLQQQNIRTNLNSDINSNNVGDISIKCENINSKDVIDIISTTVLQHPQRR